MDTHKSNPIKVIVGATHWTLNGVNIFSANLVRGLLKKGFDAQILLTEEKSKLISINEETMPKPSDIPFSYLPVDLWRQTWGGQWGALIKYLEEMSPCIYIPNYDWRHSCVAPLLSDNVGIIGIIHSDDPLHYDHAKRQGMYWNKITAVSDLVAEKTIAMDHNFRSKLSTIYIGVDIPPVFHERAVNPKAPLKLIYHGSLKQHQKRIFDIPKIIARLVDLNIPAEITIAGTGPDAMQLKSISKDLINQKVVTFTGIVSHENILPMLEAHDIFILTSEFEGMPNALLEAMGRGCIPVVTDIASAVPNLIKNGHNGYIVKTGDVDAFGYRIKELYENPEKRLRISQEAYKSVATGNFHINHMVESYETLIKSVSHNLTTGEFKRPKGLLIPPPEQINGVDIFPVTLNHQKTGIGSFPSEFPDFKHFQHFTEKLNNPKSPLFSISSIAIKQKKESLINELKGIKIIFSTPAWTNNGVNTFTETLAREFSDFGIRTEILITEEIADLVDIKEPVLPIPDDLHFKYLPAPHNQSWRTQWGRVVQHLNHSAPCIYIPGYDWRHSCVSPVLADDVAVVGIVHDDHQLYYDHVNEIGCYWNAIVTVNQTITEKIVSKDPEFEKITSVIMHGLDVPDERPVKPENPGSPTFICIGIYDNETLQRFHSIFEKFSEALNQPEFVILWSGPEEDLTDSSVFKNNIVTINLQTIQEKMLQDLFKKNDFIIFMEPINTAWKMLYEAMGNGCIPIINDTPQMKKVTEDLIKNNINGVFFSETEIATLVTTLIPLQSLHRRQTMVDNVFESAVANVTRTNKDVCLDYLQLFADVSAKMQNKSFRRKRHNFYPLLKKVNGILVFPGIIGIFQKLKMLLTNNK